MECWSISSYWHIHRLFIGSSRIFKLIIYSQRNTALLPPKIILCRYYTCLSQEFAPLRLALRHVWCRKWRMQRARPWALRRARSLRQRRALARAPRRSSQLKAKPTGAARQRALLSPLLHPQTQLLHSFPRRGFLPVKPAQANTAAMVAEVLTQLQQGSLLQKLPTTVVDAARSRSRSRRWSGGDEHWCRQQRGDNSELHAAGWAAAFAGPRGGNKFINAFILLSCNVFYN